MQPAQSHVSVENDVVRVTRWTFEPGQRTGHHRHEHPYVVVPVTHGRLRIETADGATTADLVAGESYAREAGVEHDVSNAGSEPLVFVEVEVKH